MSASGTNAELRMVGEDLLEAARRYWEAAHRHGVSGAVIWLQGMDGRLVIVTRGEYKETLMRNIDHLGPAYMFGAAVDPDTT